MIIFVRRRILVVERIADALHIHYLRKGIDRVEQHAGAQCDKYCGKYYQDGDELESHAPSRFSDSVIFSCRPTAQTQFTSILYPAP